MSTLNMGMRGLKQPILEGVAKGRGFFGAGPQNLMTADKAVNKMIRGVAPGLPTSGKALDQVHRGSLRMGLGNLLSEKTPFGGVGEMLTRSGERAMGRQATNVNTRAFQDKFNQTAKSMVQESRQAGGVTPGTMKEMERFKNLRPGNKNMVPGAVSANAMEQAKAQAAMGIKSPNSMKPLATGGTGHVRFTPGRGLGRGLIGAGLGTMIGGPVGGLLGGAGGLATGTLGTGGTALAAGGLYGASKLLGGGAPQTDPTGLPQDRNRVLPFMSNNWAGGIGGALLASIIGREMGLQGPLSWLLPALGGVAGYKMLPGLINSWSDPKGVGANSIPEIQRGGNAATFGYRTQP
jgi:hypothetical protein